MPGGAASGSFRIRIFGVEPMLTRSARRTSLRGRPYGRARRGGVSFRGGQCRHHEQTLNRWAADCREIRADCSESGTGSEARTPPSGFWRPGRVPTAPPVRGFDRTDIDMGGQRVERCWHEATALQAASGPSLRASREKCDSSNARTRDEEAPSGLLRRGLRRPVLKPTLPQAHLRHEPSRSRTGIPAGHEVGGFGRMAGHG